MSLSRQIFQLFDRKGRWQLILMLLAVVAMSILEALGVASIMPFMALVANPDAIAEHDLLQKVYTWLHFTDTTKFLIFAGLVSLAAMIISNTASALTTWFTAKLSWNQNFVLSTRLLAKYLAQPYMTYLNLNTADLAKNILSEVTNVTVGVLLPWTTVIARGTVVAFIVILLVAVDGKLALLVAVGLGVAYGVIYMQLSKAQRSYGAMRLAANTERFKTVNEALMGIKDVQVLGREAHFVRRFRAPARRFADVMASNSVAGTFPRYAMETVAFGAIILIMVYMLGTGRDLSSVLPIVALYTLAGYRLMPSLQQILKSLFSMRFNHDALLQLHKSLSDSSGEKFLGPKRLTVDAAPMELHRSIELRGVGFTYPGADRPALHSIDLTIPREARIAFVGSTGAGKSTLIDLLLGLLPPDSGVIKVDGTPLTSDNIRSWRRSVGYVPQQIFISDDTIASNIAFGIPAAEVDMSAVHAAAQVANIHDFVSTLPEAYDTMIGERGVRLSGGQRQRIGIARAVYSDPAVIVFDEATSALDGITEAAVMEAVHKVGETKTLIMIAHRISSVADCDTIYLLEHGRIVHRGTYSEVYSSSEAFRQMAGSR